MSSSTYNPGIPLGSQTLAQTHQSILTNFADINTDFGIDHVEYTAATNRGKHKKATLINLAGDATTIANEGAIYTKTQAGGTIVDLFYRFPSNGTVIPLSPRAYGQCTGAVVTYGYNIASIANGGAGIYTVTFTTALANANYMVYITYDNVAGGAFITPFVFSIGSKAVGSFQIFSYLSTTGALFNFINSIDILVIGS